MRDYYPWFPVKTDLNINCISALTYSGSRVLILFLNELEEEAENHKVIIKNLLSVSVTENTVKTNWRNTG